MQRLQGEFLPAVGGTGPAPESPSLFAAGSSGPPAFEVKFLLTEVQARAVEAALRPHLAPDPHADPARGSYLTTSLYTDTPAFDVFHRRGPLGRRKYRVRAYGAGATAFLERKAKRGDRVRKRRSAVPVAELPNLGGDVPPAWVGAWFHQQLGLRKLRPVCRIAYERVALTGTAEGHPVRATFDRHVRGEPAEGWGVEPVGSAPTLLDGRVIGEFKFRAAMPALFKRVVADLGLTPSGVSKYRLFVRSAGLAGGGAADA
jgi:hypothetical protein